MVPVPFPFARLNALQPAVNILTVYQTHVFAKLHKQNENWLHLKFLLSINWSIEKDKTNLKRQLFPSSWCYWRSSFRQVWEMHFWIMLGWIIWFNLWNQWENQLTNQLSNQPNKQKQNEESTVYQKSIFKSFKSIFFFLVIYFFS